jgi:hypothetical protein
MRYDEGLPFRQLAEKAGEMLVRGAGGDGLGRSDRSSYAS